MVMYREAEVGIVRAAVCQTNLKPATLFIGFAFIMIVRQWYGSSKENVLLIRFRSHSMFCDCRIM